MAHWIESLPDYSRVGRGRALMILDTTSFHKDAAVLNLLDAKGYDVIIIAGGTTYLMQPNVSVVCVWCLLCVCFCVCAYACGSGVCVICCVCVCVCVPCIYCFWLRHRPEIQNNASGRAVVKRVCTLCGTVSAFCVSCVLLVRC